jgi:hypothetical protein
MSARLADMLIADARLRGARIGGWWAVTLTTADGELVGWGRTLGEAVQDAYAHGAQREAVAS